MFEIVFKVLCFVYVRDMSEFAGKWRHALMKILLFMLIYFILLGDVCLVRLCFGDTCLNLLENLDIPYDYYFTLKTYLILCHLFGKGFYGLKSFNVCAWVSQFFMGAKVLMFVCERLSEWCPWGGCVMAVCAQVRVCVSDCM